MGWLHSESMSTKTQSADADTATEEESEDSGFEVYPQVTQHPETIIVGEEIVDIVTSADLSSDVENTGTGVGVVYKNPTVPQGTLWKNREVPENFDSASEFNTTLKAAFAEEGNYVNGVEVDEADIEEAQDRIAEAVDVDFEEDEYRDHRLKVDYKIADESDRDADVQEVSDQILGIDVGGGVFASERVDEFTHDKVMVWYGGISGQFILRALDFNGLPSARYKEDGYLVKGLLQHPLGWFDRDEDNYPDLVETTDRSELARATQNGGMGRPPRVARPPVLRSDIEGEEVFIRIGRYNGGRMMEATIAFNDFEGDNVEEATQLEPRYEQEPEEVLADEFGDEDVYSLYHGDGWQPKIEGDAESGTEDTSGASFDVDVDTGDDSGSSGPTDDEIEFGEMVSEKIAGSGATPDEEIFPVDGDNTNLEGLVGANADQFSETPDIDAIREVIYENTSHLDVDDL